MHEELFPYYERELSYLRRFGAEFARKYPDLAGELKLEPNRCLDPHVERLLEGVALLAGRIRRKLDDELPEITDGLFSLLYPHYLAPVPPMGIAQFQVDPEAAKLTGSYTVPRGTVLHSAPVRGTTCRFRTCYPVTLWPLRVAAARIARSREHESAEPGAAWRARAVLALRIEALGGLALRDLGLDRVRFHLWGDPSLSYGLYELLGNDVVRIEIRRSAAGGEGADRATGLDGEGRSVFHEPDCLLPVGFGEDEGVIPYPPTSFTGYRLLQELFVFPEKFLFYDLDLRGALARLGCGQEAEIRLFLKRVPAFWEEVGAESFQLGATPIVNLFRKHAEPFLVDPTRMEYEIIPEVGKEDLYEVYAVDEVHAADLETGRSRRLEPFFAFRHALRPEIDTCWYLRRQPALDGATTAHLVLCDLAYRPDTPSGQSISLTLTCTNREMVRQLPWRGGPGGDFSAEGVSAFGPIVALRKPTAPIRTPMGREDEHWSTSKDDKYWRGGQWRLISHLSLNYLSLTAGGLEALQALLQLYDFQETEATENMILALVGLETRPRSRLFGGALCRGLEIDLTIDESRFAGTSYYLFTAVLDRFFALYASINSFTQLTVRASSGRVLKAWPPRAGEQPIV